MIHSFLQPSIIENLHMLHSLAAMNYSVSPVWGHQWPLGPITIVLLLLCELGLQSSLCDTFCSKEEEETPLSLTCLASPQVKKSLRHMFASNQIQNNEPWFQLLFARWRAKRCKDKSLSKNTDITRWCAIWCIVKACMVHSNEILWIKSHLYVVRVRGDPLATNMVGGN